MVCISIRPKRIPSVSDIHPHQPAHQTAGFIWNRDHDTIRFACVKNCSNVTVGKGNGKICSNVQTNAMIHCVTATIVSAITCRPDVKEAAGEGHLNEDKISS